MADIDKPAGAPCSELCAELMQMFLMPRPGTTSENIRIVGRNARDIRRGLDFLCDRGLLESREVRDVSGKKYAGVLMSTTNLGAAALMVLRMQDRKDQTLT